MFLLSLSCFVSKLAAYQKGERLFFGAISRHVLRPDSFGQSAMRQEIIHDK